MALVGGTLTNAQGAAVSATFDDVARTVDWENTGSADALVVIRTPGQPDVQVTARSGRSGRLRNVSSVYKADTVEVELRERG